jgi:hypothetical protein
MVCEKKFRVMVHLSMAFLPLTLWQSQPALPADCPRDISGAGPGFCQPCLGFAMTFLEPCPGFASRFNVILDP